MKENTHMNKELTLFQYTQPDLLPGMTSRLRTDNGLPTGNPIAITLTLMKRKEIAKAYGLEVKGQKTTDKILDLTDAMKQQIGREFGALIASRETTGVGMTARKLANGTIKYTAAIVSVDRKDPRELSDEQVARYLASKSEDEQVAILEKAEALNKAPVEVKAEETKALATAAA